MRYPRVAAFVLLALLAVAAPAAAAPEGQMTWGVHVSLAPSWFDPAETRGSSRRSWCMYALHDALVKADAGQRRWRRAWPSRGQVSPDGLRLRVHPPQGREVPQRRPRHGRGREVLLRALRGAAAKAFKDRVAAVEIAGPAAGALPPQGAVARLHDVLRDAGHRRGLDRPEEVRREGRRRGLQEGARRGGAVQVRLVHARRRAGLEAFDGYWRKTPQREAARLQGQSPTRPRGWPRSSAARSTSSTRSAASSPRS